MRNEPIAFARTLLVALAACCSLAAAQAQSSDAPAPTTQAPAPVIPLNDLSDDRMSGADRRACAFRRAVPAGLEAFVEVVERQSVKFPRATRETLKAQLTAQLRAFTLREADLFRVYAIPGYVRIYALPISTDTKTLHVALRYEVYGDDVALTNFKYNSELHQTFDVPFLTEPVAVDCPQ